MKNKVVLITGALSGIGRVTAMAFAQEGARVVISGRRPEAGQALLKELLSICKEAEYINADVRHENEVKALIDKTVERFGRLDIAVNNAGTEGKIAPIIEQTAENYNATFETNVLGLFLCLKYELRLMLKQGHGNIINVSSVAGKIGVPGAGIYGASKHAVEGLTKTAALEAVNSGIRVNAVAPGPIETDMLDRFTGTEEGKENFLATIPAKRAGTSEEVAQTILFLASNKVPYITGQSIAIDGGKLA